MATRVFSILYLCCLSCAAFTWTRQIADASDLGRSNTDLPENKLLGLLSNHVALENYSRRPDCFRRVAAQIRLRCGELETDEDERVKAAISMTLCELATATHHAVPLECKSFTAYSETSLKQNQGDCVDALSRSAQFWSSYSGYLREVPQLCFAFRRWNDIDTAKDIYKNSTMENAALIRFILAREQADIEGKQRWDSHISELEEVTLRFKAVSDVIDVVVHTATPKLRDELESIADAFKAELTDIQANSRHESSQVINRIVSELEVITQHHARSFDSISPFLQTSLAHDLNTILSLFEAQTLQALDIANSAQYLWINLTQQFDDLQQKFLLLSDGVSDNTIALETSQEHAQLVLDAQHSASLSASNLADVLDHLTASTRDSLEQLNASAVLLTQSLSPRTGFSEFMRLVDMVWRLDPYTVASLHHLPILPIVSAVFSFLLTLFRSSLAALMSFGLFLLSTRKYAMGNAYSETPHSAPLTTIIHRESHRREIRKSRIPDRLCRGPSKRS